MEPECPHHGKFCGPTLRRAGLIILPLPIEPAHAFAHFRLTFNQSLYPVPNVQMLCSSTFPSEEYCNQKGSPHLPQISTHNVCGRTSCLFFFTPQPHSDGLRSTSHKPLYPPTHNRGSAFLPAKTIERSLYQNMFVERSPDRYTKGYSVSSPAGDTRE